MGEMREMGKMERIDQAGFKRIQDQDGLFDWSKRRWIWQEETNS